MVQLILWNLWRLGAMDSLHVSSQQTGSKTSSRSASPSRPREQQQQQPFHPHHTKTLSHGSVDSCKSHDGIGSGIQPQRPARQHRSPTASLNRTGPPGGTTAVLPGGDMDDSVNQVYLLDDSGGGNLMQEYDPSDYPPSYMSNGSNELKTEDDTDSLDPKTNAILEQLGTKIIRVKDLIRMEQKLRDDNVNEYLKLAANADKQQVQRIKAVFEKKNQKSAHVISQLQKKLDVYQKRVHELETHGAAQGHRPPREVLRDMGQGLKNVGGNIRDGISYVGGSVMSKPREFAHLIKNKFGSADNISQLSRTGEGSNANKIIDTGGGGPTGSEGSGIPANGGSDHGDKSHHHHHGSTTLPATLHVTTSQSSMGGHGGVAGATGHGQHHQSAGKLVSEEGSGCSSVTSDSIGRYGREGHDKYSDVNKKIRLVQDQLDNFRENFDIIKSLQQEIQDLNSSLQEERFRSERLEEQINDLTELHQNEVENLKQAMADMEEKVQYQSEERLRDIHEMLEHCQTKIQKMEHQALQQQQYVTLEGLDNSNARALVVKLINVLLTVLQVILLLVATGAGIIMPFLRTRLRILSTVILVVGIAFVLRQWPEVRDIGSHMMRRLKDTLDPAP
ncbi:transmembrane and coiled-coil domains protein 2 isoform X2 [Diorhabda carinulata]|uniref:transmembrane and coiled-coil domains protein 2 isoform X2 n=1 Tax=Diorhabda sublineata TaxID=1163346 RepID=UPI0024E18344|nr:transmembrane and coiled-coil domains protein 2 isoform X2 [Diorhabda sublineata]XP_057655208.1 transmembrane and coiled-coil domains protein 2 isoform X2 [Diorhabda carinulata]